MCIKYISDYIIDYIILFILVNQVAPPIASGVCAAAAIRMPNRGDKAEAAGSRDNSDDFSCTPPHKENKKAKNNVRNNL